MISEIRVFSYDLPVVGGYRMSTSAVTVPSSTIVEIETSDGLVGYGEVCLATPTYQPEHNKGIVAAMAKIAPAVIGLDPMQLDVIGAAMSRSLSGHNEARSAIEIACWDLIGKSVGRPVCDLLGGPVVDPVPTYHVVAIAEPQDAANQAADLQDAGLRKLQLKVGGRPIAADIDSIRAVGSVLRPDTQLAIDANRGWTGLETQLVSNACRDVPLSIEQPCDTYQECVRIRPLLNHPLLLDESMTSIAAVLEAAGSGSVDGFGMKTSRIGGLRAMQTVREICRAARLPTSADDAWGGDIIAAACVHLGSTIDPQLNRGAWIAQPYVGQHYDSENGPRINDGHVAVPTGGPGLGLVIAPGRFGEPVAVYSP